MKPCSLQGRAVLIGRDGPPVECGNAAKVALKRESEAHHRALGEAGLRQAADRTRAAVRPVHARTAERRDSSHTPAGHHRWRTSTCGAAQLAVQLCELSQPRGQGGWPGRARCRRSGCRHPGYPELTYCHPPIAGPDFDQIISRQPTPGHASPRSAPAIRLPHSTGIARSTTAATTLACRDLRRFRNCGVTCGSRRVRAGCARSSAHRSP